MSDTPIWDQLEIDLDMVEGTSLACYKTYLTLAYLPIRSRFQGFRWNGDTQRYCGRGPCCLGDQHDGRCTM